MSFFKKYSNPDTDTSHLSKNLGKNAAKAFASVAVTQVIANIIGLGGSIILARLLGPEEFGLMAMLATAIALLTVFENFGLYFATVQKKYLSSDELNFLFWANLGVASIMSVLMFFSAPYIANFFEQPQLYELAQVLSLAFICRGAANQHAALLNRKLQHGKSSLATTVAVFFATGGAIIMALTGFGIWALVWRQIIEAFVRMIMIWSFTQWIPRWVKWDNAFIPSLTIGLNLTASNLMYYLSRNTDDILIGKFIGNAGLGHYKLSYQILLLPLRRLSEPVAQIMIPVLSQLQDDAERYRRNYTRVAHILILALWPIGVVFIMHADTLVYIIFGAEWFMAAEPLRWLASLLLIQGITNTTGWLLISQARSKEILYWSIFTSVTTIASFIIGLPYGIVGVAAAYVIVEYLRIPLLFYIIGRSGPVSIKNLYNLVLVHVPPLFIFVFVQWGVGQVIIDYSISFKILFIMVGGLSILPSILIFPHSRAILFDIFSHIKTIRNKEKTSLL
ncbi:MAG: lipopolysaccharide biosynthesis protein [Alphaproteobacteria bacterium]